MKSLKVSPEVLKEAEKEGSSREFFFRLLELLSGGALKRKEIKSLNHRELIKEIVKENSLEDYFFPSRSKNIYNALRKAFKLKEREEVESKWEENLKNWREEFEELLLKAASKYLLKVKDEELLKELYRKEWLLPSDILNAFEGKDFKNWILKVSTLDFLEGRLERWLKLPPFKRREKILRDILKAYSLNCIELAIYGLFPQCEGVVWDTFVKENTLEADVEALIRKRNRKFVTIQYATKLLLQDVFGQEELPSFLNHISFVEYKDGVLNRHAIGHGVAVKFGTKENFLKLFYFLDFLSEIIDLVFKSKL